LKQRELYVDTNVLYSLRVPASNYHESVNYFVDRLRELGVTIRVFPFTIEEYEKSLALTEQEFNKKSTFSFKVEPLVVPRIYAAPGAILRADWSL
jgi:hypothetical protein